MPSKKLSISYATTGSAPIASGIGWINWDDLILNPGETYSISISLLNNLEMTFDITNTPQTDNGFVLLPDIPMKNSAFGTLGYTNISGNIALETFTDYYSTTFNSSKFTLSNISVKDSYGNPLVGYSVVLASIQVNTDMDSAFISEPIQCTQTLSTNGSDWNNIIWLGNTSSPSVDTTDQKNIIISPTSFTSGSPVYSSNSPTDVSVTISANTSIPQFSIGIAIASLTLQKIINGRLSSYDQFDLSIVGSESDIVTTTGSSNGLQVEKASVNGPVQSHYRINESMASNSINSLNKYTQLISWKNNTSDGTPAPTTGYLGQSIFIDIGDDFVATITNTPKASTNQANSNSGPDSDKLYWINWENFELAPNSTAQIIAPISSKLSLSFTITNNSNSLVKGSAITNSAFGSSLYTGLLGNNCLEITCNDSQTVLTLDNIQLINNQKGTSFDYSLILASIQYSSNTPTNYTVTQQFTTDGSPWSLLAWAGVTTSPTVTYSGDHKTVTVTTIDKLSGSPVFISDPPTQITCTFSNTITPYICRFAFGVNPTQIYAPSRGVNIFKK